MTTGKYEQVAIDTARIALELDKDVDSAVVLQVLSAFRDIPGIVVYRRCNCPKLRYRTPAGGNTADAWAAIRRWAGVKSKAKKLTWLSGSGLRTAA